MPLEYLSGNELLRYPFRAVDSPYSNLGVELTTTVFADMLVSLKSPLYIGAQVFSLSRSGTTAFVSISLINTDGDPESLTAFSVNLSTVVKHETIAFDNQLCTLRIVPGSDFVSFFNSLDNAVGHTYSCNLVDDAIFLHVPRVKQVAFYNLDDLEAVIEGDELIENELILLGGSNVDFILESNKLVMSVSPGAGTGLYNPCSGDLVIKSINNTLGDPIYNNFTFLTDGCYTVERGNGIVDDFGLQFANICTPKCTDEQLGAFAHYLNRVKDGMLSISTYAAGIYAQMETYIDNYRDNVLPTYKTPFIKSTLTKFDNGYGDTYYSIVVGFFNRDDSGPVDIDVDIDGGIFVSGIYKQGPNTNILSEATHSTTLACLKASRLEVVLAAPGPFTVTATAGTTSYTEVYS